MTYIPAYVQVQPKPNQFGIVGFVFGVLGVLLCWVPWIALIAPVLGAFGMVFAVIGLFRSPRKYAIAGFALSAVALASPFLVWPLIAKL